MVDESNLDALKERLVGSALDPNDIKFLEELIAIHEKEDESDQIAGRPVVARLPFGMDAVK